MTKSLVLRDQCRRGPELLAARIRVERDVAVSVDLFDPGSGIVEGRIQNVAAFCSLPLEPGVRLLTGRRTFADNQAEIGRAVSFHPLIKGHRFSFAVSRLTRFNLSRRFPQHLIAIGNIAQLTHPRIDQADRSLIGGRTGHGQDLMNSGHLAIVWGGIYGKEQRIRKTGGNRDGDGGEKKERLFGDGEA